MRLGYNPNNPSEVIWVDDYSNLVLFIIGPIFIVIGLVISIGGLFKKNKNRDGVISDNQNNMINSELQQQNGLYNNPNIVNETGANVPLQNTNNNNQNNGNIGG